MKKSTKEPRYQWEIFKVTPNGKTKRIRKRTTKTASLVLSFVEEKPYTVTVNSSNTHSKALSIKNSKKFATGYSAALAAVLSLIPDEERGVHNCYWGDTEFDSESAAYGFNEALACIRENIIRHKDKLQID